MAIMAIGNTGALQIAHEQEFHLGLELELGFRVRNRVMVRF